MEKKVVNESLPYCYDRVCKSIILKDGNSTDGSVMHPEGHRCHGKLFRLVIIGAKLKRHEFDYLSALL